MASRATQAFATSVKVIGGSNVPAYTLEFLTPTPKHPKGSFETVIVPYIELGRENCLISFGNDMPTVSRKHAALERKGKDTIIKNLSKTNPTLVNGRPVLNQFYLNSGDEIQLSLEGPRLRYNESQIGTTKMAFTKRMNLVMRQAIRPYKRAFIVVAILVLVALVVGAFLFYKMREDTKNTLIKIEASNKQQTDSLAKLNAVNQNLEAKLLAKKAELQQVIAMQEKVRQAKKKNRIISQIPKTSHRPLGSKVVQEVNTPAASAESLVMAMKQKVLIIYLNRILVEWNSKVLYEDTPNESVCSGFLLQDGLFVTARQCIDIHAPEPSELNFIANSGGKVTYFFRAVSPDEKVNISFTNHDMVYDASGDVYEQYTFQGIKGNMKLFDPATGQDWAYLKTKFTGGMAYDSRLSSGLRVGTDLFSLGFTYGSASIASQALPEPHLSRVTITGNDEEKKYRKLNSNGIDMGNTGGPLFYIKDNQALAVAIVSGKSPGGANSTHQESFITPLANIRN